MNKMKDNNSITAEDIKTRILKGISEVFRGKTIYMKDIEEDVEQYAQAKVLEALERVREKLTEKTYTDSFVSLNAFEVIDEEIKKQK